MTKENWIAIGGIVVTIMTSAISWLITWKNTSRQLKTSRQSTHPVENRRIDIQRSWRGGHWAKTLFFLRCVGAFFAVVALVLLFIYPNTLPVRTMLLLTLVSTALAMYNGSRALWPYKP